MAAAAAILEFGPKRFSYFYITTHPMLPANFRVNWPFGSGEEAKIDFQDGRHGDYLGIPIGTILAIFFLDLQVTPMLLTKFQVNLPLGSGEEATAAILNFGSKRF